MIDEGKAENSMLMFFARVGPHAKKNILVSEAIAVLGLSHSPPTRQTIDFVRCYIFMQKAILSPRLLPALLCNQRFTMYNLTLEIAQRPIHRESSSFPLTTRLIFTLFYSHGITWTYLFEDSTGRGLAEVLGPVRTCLAAKPAWTVWLRYRRKAQGSPV